MPKRKVSSGEGWSYAIESSSPTVPRSESNKIIQVCSHRKVSKGKGDTLKLPDTRSAKGSKIKAKGRYEITANMEPNATETYRPKQQHTFTHSGTVVNDKGGNIFVISHGESCLKVIKEDESRRRLVFIDLI